jgi:phosphoglycolate phosphatase
MTPRFSAVLFDLDGTIVDSAPGITSSLEHTLEQLGLPRQTPAELLRWVGPPILDSFRDYGHLDPEQSRYALGIYREKYSTEGVFDATAYPGVLEVLRAVHAAGVPLSLATSKPESLAKLILAELGVTECFTEITGASEDEVRSKKADVVEEALRRLRADGADLSNVVMVGDRIHDVEGAAEHGVPTIFVSWGYGTPDEADEALLISSTAEELRGELGV